MKAIDIYNNLIKHENILNEKGHITFKFADIKIIVKAKDVVGNIIQEWLQGYFDKNKIEYLTNSNSQMPPDFFLNKENKMQDLLEVKAFNRKASPGFDIADFRMYEEEIIDKPYMLDVDYLIFGYEMKNNGDVVIKDLWLKKVWEITRPMQKWALNLQIKQNVVHKIRPGVWYSQKSKMFESLEDFISAVEETVYQNPKTHNEASRWKNNFLESYRKFYNKTIDIPRWNDIKQKYSLNN